MSRHDTAALVAALLCVAALGLAAATVAAPVDNEQFTRNFEDTTQTSSTPFDFDLDSDNLWQGDSTGGGGSWTFSTQCVPFLTTPLFYAFALVSVLGLYLGVSRAVASEYGFATVAFLLPISLFVHATFTEGCFEDPVHANFGLPAGTVVNETVQQATRPVSPESSTPILGLIVAGAFVLLVVGALMTTVRQQSDPLETTPAEPEATSSHDLAGIARVAGEAADRIEGGEADAENAVYRTWQEMTGHLDVSQTQTTTPAEFREAALAAGMSRPDVATITDLFREVRYGGEAPTEDREDRAVAALRAIEAAYGGDES